MSCSPHPTLPPPKLTNTYPACAGMPSAAGSSSTKVTPDLAKGSGYKLSSYLGGTCAGNAVGTVAINADATCKVTSAVPTSASLVPFANLFPKATDLTFGFYSDATCDTPVQATLLGMYGYLTGASGTCLALPGGASSAKIEYTSAKMDVSLFGGAGCVTANAVGGTISGAPGTCEELLTTGLAAAQAASYCPATGNCYIYVFPAGAVAPESSGASSASLAAVTVAGAVAAAALLA